MRRRLALIALPALLVVPALVASGASAAVDPEPVAVDRTVAKKAPQVARGLIVKAATNSAARRTSLARAAEAALPLAVDVDRASAAPAGLTALRLERPVPTEDLEEVVDALNERADVEWVVPDTLRTVSSAPPVAVNDPYAGVQGNLWDTRDTIDGRATTGGYATKAPALWRATRGSASVVVAVVDTGITSHPDLTGQTVPGYDFVDDECTADGRSCFGTYVNAGDGNGWDANPTDPGDWRDAALATRCYGLGAGDDPDDYVADSSWHGTHVAGTVAARAGNGIGVAGVAPGVKVQPVRVLGHCGGWDSDILYGVLWASGEDLRSEGVPLNRTPAKVINLSLGGEYGSAADAADACHFYSLVATEARANGATLVAAAGNASAGSIFPIAKSVPASCHGYVTVVATSDTGHRAWYSTAGGGADIAAAGGDQNVGTYNAERGILSTLNEGTTTAGRPTYGWYQGTSMAAPAVSAAAALLYSLGVTDPAAVESKLKAAVQPFSTVSKGSQTARNGAGQSLTTATINCTTSGATSCGAGILDLSRVSAPSAAPAVTGRAVVGSTLRGTARGLVGPSVSSQLSWWRGATRISTTGAYRVRATDAGKRLTVRHTVASGPFAGIHRDTSVTVAKVASRTKLAMPAKVKRSQRATVKVKVTASGLRPTGRIRVFDGKRRIAVKQLKAGHRGTLKITLPKLKKKGKHRIRVVYVGSAQVKGSTRTKVVRVR